MPRGRKPGSKNKSTVEQSESVVGSVTKTANTVDEKPKVAASVGTANCGDLMAQLFQLAMSVNKTTEKYDQSMAVLVNFQNQVNTILVNFDQRIKMMEGAQRSVAPVFSEKLPVSTVTVVAKEAPAAVPSQDNSNVLQTAAASQSPSQPGLSMNGRVNEAADLGLD